MPAYGAELDREQATTARHFAARAHKGNSCTTGSSSSSYGATALVSKPLSWQLGVAGRHICQWHRPMARSWVPEMIF
eukprot:COSAG01_NODE_4584_length_4898_cov_18.985622_6_plen_77_part_00